MVDVYINKNLLYGSIIIMILFILIVILVLALSKPKTSCQKLSPPLSVTITTDPELKHVMVITWSHVPQATTYGVYVRSMSGITKNIFDRKIFTTETSITIKDLHHPNQYVRISSFNSCGEGNLSSEKHATIECKLDPPENLDASIINPQTAQASWDSVLGAQGYHMYVNGQKIYSGAIPTVSFATPTSGDYQIRVSTQNACGEGDKSGILIYNVPVLFI